MVEGKNDVIKLFYKTINIICEQHYFNFRLARCNDPTVVNRSDCVGVFMRRVFVTKMKLKLGTNESYPAMLVPRVW